MSFPTTTQPQEQDSEQTSLAKINAILAGSLPGSGSAVIPLATQPKQYTAASTATPVTSNGNVFTIAASEKGFIQNLDDAALYVKLGSGASTTSFHYILKAGTAANDGTGGIAVIDDFIGVVSIFAATGDPRASAFKLT